MFTATFTVSLVFCFAPAPLPRPSSAPPTSYLGIDARNGNGGVVVGTIYISAPASEGGISASDLIVSIAGNQTRNLVELRLALRKVRPGNTVPVVVRRGGEEVRCDVKLGARRNYPYLGVSLSSTAIDDMPDDSPSRKAGLRPGDVFVTVGGKSIGTREDVVAAISKRHVGDAIDVVVNRNGTEMTVPVKLGSRPGY